jgi:hypothetical protein
LGREVHTLGTWNVGRKMNRMRTRTSASSIHIKVA